MSEDNIPKPITPEQAIALHDELTEKDKADELYHIKFWQDYTIENLNKEISLRYFELESADKPIRLDFTEHGHVDCEFIKEITNKYYYNGIVLTWEDSWLLRYIDCYLVKNTARIEAKKQQAKKGWFKRLFS